MAFQTKAACEAAVPLQTVPGKAGPAPAWPRHHRRALDPVQVDGEAPDDDVINAFFLQCPE